MRHFTIQPVSRLIIATQLLFSLLLFVASPTQAAQKKAKKTTATATDDRGLAVVDKNRDGRKRIALVIGNSSYASSPLRNPANDARAMAQTLRRLGFEVDERTDLGIVAMNEAVEKFGSRLHSGGVGLFYYAGHGMQVHGNNYLIPVDAKISAENEVRYKAVDAGLVLAKMEQAKSDVNIVVLDACRDNPFSRSFRSSNRGLANMEAPNGTFIAYATAPGKTAADGNGKNGLYTQELVRVLESPGLKLEDVFKRASKGVKEKSGNQQTPWVASNLDGDFWFVPPSSMTDLKPSPVLPQPVQSTPVAEPQYEPPAPHPVAFDRIEMVNIHGGCFQMGDNFGDGFSDEKPVHGVCVSDFAIGKYEVTVAQFRSFVNATDYSTEAEKGDGCYVLTEGDWAKNASFNWKNPGFSQEDTHPVACVSWNDATTYIRWLSGQSGRKYRLRTEAEWEYAARSGGKRERYSGGDNVYAVAWYSGNSWSKTQPVGQKQANGLGIYDMSGNV